MSANNSSKITYSHIKKKKIKEVEKKKRNREREEKDKKIIFFLAKT